MHFVWLGHLSAEVARWRHCHAPSVSRSWHVVVSTLSFEALLAANLDLLLHLLHRLSKLHWLSSNLHTSLHHWHLLGLHGGNRHLLLASLEGLDWDWLLSSFHSLDGNLDIPFFIFCNGDLHVLSLHSLNGHLNLLGCHLNWHHLHLLNLLLLLLLLEDLNWLQIHLNVFFWCCFATRSVHRLFEGAKLS